MCPELATIMMGPARTRSGRLDLGVAALLDAVVTPDAYPLLVHTT
jgi:hypothetical protein